MELTCSRIWLGRDGVVRHAVNGVVDREDFVAAIDAIRTLANNQPMPILIDFRGIRRFSREARRMASDPDTTRKPTALAVVVGNPVTRVIGTFATRIRRPSCPIRLFTDPHAAFQWALQHRVLPFDDEAHG